MSLDAVTIIGAILSIGFLIVVHEAGHYIVARWCNMRVDRFSVGFGPALIKRRFGETDFTIGPIPFGGFVQINGMLLAEDVEGDPRAYPNRPVWQRFATIFAGPATNYLAAIVFALLFFTIEGIETGTEFVAIESIAVGEGFDAEGKLEVDDVIETVNGKPIFKLVDGKRPTTSFVDLVQASEGKPLELTILRGGKELAITLIAKPNPEYEKVKDLPAERGDQPAFRIGVELGGRKERTGGGFFGTIKAAVLYPFRETRTILYGLYKMATDKEVRKQSHLSSVVGITVVTKQALDHGFTSLLYLLMKLNIFLGLFNLFPLPALDGGRLVFLGYEMVTRRRANPKIEATVHMFGIMALMLLLIVVTYGDIKRLAGG